MQNLALTVRKRNNILETGVNVDRIHIKVGKQSFFI